MNAAAAEVMTQLGTQHLGELLTEAVLKLNRYALARNRATDKEPRSVTLTDDEAAAILFALDVYGAMS